MGGLLYFTGQNHRQKGILDFQRRAAPKPGRREKRRKALDRSRTKDDNRNPATPPDSFTESYGRAAQQQQYPALASAMNTTNQAFNSGKKPRFEIYAVQQSLEIAKAYSLRLESDLP